jgi:hypothetical protein
MAGYEISKPWRVRPDFGQAPVEGGQGDLAHVALGGEAVGQKAVGHLAGHLGHELAHPGQEDRRRAVGVRSGVEERGHEGVGVEVAPEGQLGAVVPRRPDGPHGLDELAHPGGGVRPRHRVPLGDVGLDLRAQAEHEPAFREGWRSLAMTAVVIGLRAKATAIPVPNSMRSVCSAARSSGKNGSCRLGAPESVESVLFGPLPRGDGVSGIEAESSVDEHRGTLSDGSGPAFRVSRLLGRTACRRRHPRSSRR